MIRFTAGTTGTYLYGATPGTVDGNVREREQLSGALVIDSAERAPGRSRFRDQHLGRAERLRQLPQCAGDQRKVVAVHRAIHGDRGRQSCAGAWSMPVRASTRCTCTVSTIASMRVARSGRTRRDARQRELARDRDVMGPGRTMSMVWSPDRPGNWLFHCHIGFHADPRHAAGLCRRDCSSTHCRSTPASTWPVLCSASDVPRPEECRLRQRESAAAHAFGCT